MAHDESNEDNFEPRQLIDEIDSTINTLTSLHETMIEKTTEVGFALEAVKKAKQNYATIVDMSEEITELRSVAFSGYGYFTAINNEVSSLQTNLASPLSDIRSMAQNVGGTCIISGSVVSSLVPGYDNQVDFPTSLSSDSNGVYNILNILDPSLGQTYKEVEQVYYGTNADNTKTSLGQIRQTFDHFFSTLAPDEEVMKSKFWKREKNDKGQEIVTRKERIQYAIATHIKNPYKAKSLEGSLNVIISSYRVLNSFHERGRINARSAKQALFTVKHFLESFAEAIDS
jgi:hypothetical protein